MTWNCGCGGINSTENTRCYLCRLPSTLKVDMPPLETNVSAEAYVCTDCKRHMVTLGYRPMPGVCAACLTHPGWHEDPELRRVFGYDTPPEEPSQYE